MRFFENSNFTITKTMLRKIKQKEYFTDDGGIIPDLFNLLSNFKYVHTQCMSQRLSEFIKNLAYLVEYEYIKEGEYIDEQSTNDTFFVLKGEVIALEERSQRNIMQDQYWSKKLQAKKKELEDTFDTQKKQEILQEIDKIERAHKYFSDIFVEDYLRADLLRYSDNFNAEGECLFKEFSIIKAGMTFGKDSNSFLIEKNNIQKGNLDVFIQNELKQRKVKFIAGKNLHIFRLAAEKHQILYQEIYESKQRIIDFLQSKLESLKINQELLELVSSRAHKLQLFEGQAIYLQNSEKPTHFYLLLNGIVEISTLAIKHSPEITYIQGPTIIGLEFQGEQSQFRQYSCRCKSEQIEIYKINYQEIKQLPNNKLLMEEIMELGESQNKNFKQSVNQKLEQYKLSKQIFSTRLQHIYQDSPKHISYKFLTPQNRSTSSSGSNTQRFSVNSSRNFFPYHPQKQQETQASPIKITENSQSPTIKKNKQLKSHNLLSKLSTNDQLNNSQNKLNSSQNLDNLSQREEKLINLANTQLKQYLQRNSLLNIKTSESEINPYSAYFQMPQQKTKKTSLHQKVTFRIRTPSKLSQQNSFNQSSSTSLIKSNNQVKSQQQASSQQKIPTFLLDSLIPELKQCFMKQQQ